MSDPEYWYQGVSFVPVTVSGVFFNDVPNKFIAKVFWPEKLDVLYDKVSNTRV